MKTSVEFLDLVKARLDIGSDTDLAKAIGLSKQQISTLRGGINSFGDETARRVAGLLGVDPAYVISCAYAERASSPEIKMVWVKMAKAFATIAFGVTLSAPSPQARAEVPELFNNNIHYTKLCLSYVPYRNSNDSMFNDNERRNFGNECLSMRHRCLPGGSGKCGV